MKVMQFFANLLPNFERSRIVEDVESLREEVKDVILPSLQQAASLTHGKPLQAEVSKSFNAVYGLTFKDAQRSGFIAHLLAFYSTLDAKLEIIERMIPSLFSKDVTKESMTYRKAALLQYLTATRFVNDYTSRLLGRVVFAEQQAALKQDAMIDSLLTPADVKFLAEHQAAYLQALKVLSLPVKDLTSAFDSIPEIVIVPDRYSTVVQTVGAGAIDPMQMNLIGTTYNPIYFFRSLGAERQVEDYKRSKELKRSLELKLMALRQAQVGKQDAKIQQQITHMEGRIQRLNHSIAEFDRQIG